MSIENDRGINKDLANRDALFRDLENGMSKAPDQGTPEPSKGGSALDRALDGIASKGREMTGQAPDAKSPSKGGSALDRALDGIAAKGQEMTRERGIDI